MSTEDRKSTQELYRKLGLPGPHDFDRAWLAQKYLEKFPDTTKEQLSKILDTLTSPEFRAAYEAHAREERRQARKAELAARRAEQKITGLNILILGCTDVGSWIEATLRQRGHLVTTLLGGAISPRIAEAWEDYDGCLLLRTDPDLLEVADIFKEMGKKVWRELADIPRDRDRSQP